MGFRIAKVYLSRYADQSAEDFVRDVYSLTAVDSPAGNDPIDPMLFLAVRLDISF